MYVRFTKLTFDPANYDAMIKYRDNTIVPKLNEMRLKGLIRVRMFSILLFLILLASALYALSAIW